MPGLHHYHLRKRKQESKRESRLVKAFDKVIYGVAILGPLTTLPQVFNIWGSHTAQGVSAFTFSAYLMINLFWLTYGAIHREKPIMLSYSLWFLVNGSVALGAILYG